MLGAAIIFQAWRAQPGTAAEEKPGRTTGTAVSGDKSGGSNSTSGKAKLNSTGTPASAQGTSDDAAQISRNGKRLSLSMRDVEAECVRRLGREVLDNMINRATIQLACQEKNVVVTSAEVDREMTRIASEFKIPLEQYLLMLQTERGINPEQYRNDVIWPMLALRKLAGEEVQVTSAEIKKAFERDYGPRVKVRMILCDNQRRAQTAWQKAKEDPDNFEKYVQEYSIDQASKSLDGTIPPIPRHSGSPNIEATAFKLQPGEVSAIVQLDNAAQRYVILKCEGRTDPVVRELDEAVKAELEDQLKRQKVQEQVAVVFENLKKETLVHNIQYGTTTGGSKPSTVARTQSAKPGETRPATKPAPADEETDLIRPASAKGTATKTVRPAAANDEDRGSPLPTTRSIPKRPTTSSK